MPNLTPDDPDAPHYLHQEFPCALYHRGNFGKVESRVFARAEDVPAEGWYDSPAKVPAAPKKPAAKRTRKPTKKPAAKADA